MKGGIWGILNLQVISLFLSTVAYLHETTWYILVCTFIVLFFSVENLNMNWYLYAHVLTKATKCLFAHI